jgi:hypothetical protein
MDQNSAPQSVVGTYFVQGFRVTKLPPIVNDTSQPGTQLPDGIIGDVVQAEVTRVCTGASQYSFTLNNYIAAPLGSVGATSNAPASLVGGNQPSWPPYKYNDFSLIAFGDRLRIDMQDYRDPSTERKLHNTAATFENQWVPMVAGPVTDMKFEFSSGSGARLTVSGEDDLSELKDHLGTRKPLGPAPEMQLVQTVLGLAGYPLQPVAPQVQLPGFATSGTPGVTETLGDSQSYLDFLQKIADRLDCEIFLEFSDLTIATSALQLHFEPARSRITPEQSAGDVFILNRDRNIIEFSPSIKVVDQPSTATVQGRNRDRNNPGQVTGNADPSKLIDELHAYAATGAPQALTSGPDVRAHFFLNRTDNPMKNANESNLDQARADTLAEAQFRRKAREFFTIDGTTIGLPRLRPGNFILITGMRPPFDGYYYVTKTVHTYGAEGMRTKFSARRPGMVMPPYQES